MIANNGTGVGAVSNPYGICESVDGGIMVCDYSNNRIQELFLDGRAPRVVVAFQDCTTPFAITRCEAADYIVTDDAKHRVFRMDGQGTIKWTTGGAQGSGVNQFNQPYGVTVLMDGRVVVADCSNNRLQVLRADTGAVVGTITRSDGTAWSNPWGIVADDRGQIYVAEYGNCRVVVVKTDGTVARTLGSFGRGEGQLRNSFGIALDSNVNVLVADLNGIVVFRPDGSSVSFPTPDGAPTDVLVTSSNRVVVCGGHRGHYVAGYQ